MGSGGLAYPEHNPGWVASNQGLVGHLGSSLHSQRGLYAFHTWLHLGRAISQRH